MTIKAIVHEGETGGYWAEVPSMPGCYTQGETLDEIVRYLWEAMEGWTESRVQFDPNSRIVSPQADQIELLIEANAVA